MWSALPSPLNIYIKLNVYTASMSGSNTMTLVGKRRRKQQEMTNEYRAMDKHTVGRAV